MSARAAAEAARRLETRRRRRLADDWPHTSRPLPWALAAFMAMVWLLPFDSISLPIPIPLDAKLDRPFLVLIGALWVLSLTNRASVSRLRMSAVHWALFVFALVAVISLLPNVETLLRLHDLELALRKLALLFSYILLFAIVASSVKPTEVRNLVIFMVGLAVVTSVGALVEYRTEYNAFFTWADTVLPVNLPWELGAVDSIGRRSLVGPTVHPLAVAMMISLTLPFALMGFLSTPERRTKVLYAVAAGLMVAAGLATQRKTSLVAPVFGVAVLLAYRPRAALRLIPTAVVLMVLIHLVAPGAMGGVTSQLLPQNMFGVLSTKDRQSDYSAVKPDVVKYPLLGRGYESYDKIKYRILDNQYLSLMIGTGLLGVLAYLGVFAAALLLAHRMARSGDPDLEPFAIAAGASIASLVVGGALLDVLALPQIPYLICFIAGLIVVASQGRATATSVAARRAVRRALAQASARRPRLIPEDA